MSDKVARVLLNNPEFLFDLLPEQVGKQRKQGKFDHLQETYQVKFLRSSSYGGVMDQLLKQYGQAKLVEIMRCEVKARYDIETLGAARQAWNDGDLLAAIQTGKLPLGPPFATEDSVGGQAVPKRLTGFAALWFEDLEPG